MKNKFFWGRAVKLCVLLGLTLFLPLFAIPALAQTQQSSGAVGVEGTITKNAPTQAPTISTPKNGATFTSLPITVAGLCQSDLLVEIFKNNVFAGSVQCASGSYSLQIDLFSGRNDFVARQYDALNQPSPDSNTVTVYFNDTLASTGPRISLTSEFAKRGAEPGDTLNWPISISGGTPPYAISVDWGDKSVPDLISQPVAGNITLKHSYSQSGVYNVIIKVTDANGAAAFLQVVGIGNGPILQTKAGAQPGATRVSINLPLIIMLTVSFPLLAFSFLLGKKHQLQTIRSRLRRGERPI